MAESFTLRHRRSDWVIVGIVDFEEKDIKDIFSDSTEDKLVSPKYSSGVFP